ncbi:transcriptional regulator [Mangrovibacter sp. MFB070]|uniref:biofilm master transcriptional regulator CsgD n=1 Tax=Mangrovibacter sp. MFB070 TaxID=1224318 RepID=UPI0004D43A5B|nr:biofilm master transcriptional regulator CsgD [Mangrovibacter sp. MFB070]KEA52639.1 transcriptional regulator [Mangrovibacter sp. MFB070]
MYHEFHRLHAQTLLLITRPSLLSTALFQYLRTELDLEGHIHNIQQPLEAIPGNTLILFDMAFAERNHIHYWQEVLSHTTAGSQVLLINMPNTQPEHNVSNWQHIAGVFFVSESEKSVLEGIGGILRGEHDFSSQIASHWMKSSPRSEPYIYESSSLTQREKEILNKLRIGASNNEIARSLFISENTVKTHLYNLFRKISVKNRTQAVSWANNHMM